MVKVILISFNRLGKNSNWNYIVDVKYHLDIMWGGKWRRWINFGSSKFKASLSAYVETAEQQVIQQASAAGHVHPVAATQKAASTSH